MFHIKPGVELNGVQPEIVLAIQVAAFVYEANGHELTVTSITDGAEWRKTGSLHLAGCAFDCRTRMMGSQTEKELVAAIIANRLGKEFDVVLESDHIHVELDIK